MMPDPTHSNDSADTNNAGNPANAAHSKSDPNSAGASDSSDAASAPMSGRSCLVTGATNGIGAATALELARQGARVIVMGRDQDKCAATCRALTDINDNGHEFLVCDFNSLEQVRRAAAEYLERAWPLDVLVNNAGAFFLKRRETADGIEASLGVNHIAPFLLTLSLLDRLLESPEPRIVNVASHAHRFAKRFEFDDLGLSKKYSSMGAYGRSKLANILFTLSLDRRLQGRATVNAMHPGAVSTGLGGSSALGKFISALLRPFFRKPEKGAETVVHLSVSPELRGHSGDYYMDCRPAPMTALARDEAVAEQLWSLSEELSGQRLALPEPATGA